MTKSTDGREWRSSRLRATVWGAAAFLLLLPRVAMQFTDEVNWDVGDFVVFGAMLLAACGTFELAARMTASKAYRAGAGVALVAAFILVWMNLAVGIIGNEENPANLMYAGVLATGILGAIVARFRASGMARALRGMAIAQSLVALIVIVAGWGQPWRDVLAIVVLNGVFVALFLVSASLFRRSARSAVQPGVA